jgi:serine/threonine protein kinase
MAKVYRGTDLLLGRKVAVKVLAANLARDPQFVVRFQREARAAASLSHTNVVSVFDTGSDGESHYIVMEYIEGQTLADLIVSDAPLDPARASTIASAVCEALAVAHAAGMVHRDVKPGNILIDAAGVVKVMDFGIAKTSSDGLTQVGSVLGTVAYLSPEQAAGERVDQRSDLYSLGCVLYEMLTGQPPISGESLIEVANKLSRYTPPPPSALNHEVPEALDSIVSKAISKLPEDRYQDAEQMRRALQKAGSQSMLPGASEATQIIRPARGGGDGRTEVLPVQPPPRSHRLGLLVSGILLVAGGLYATFSGTEGTNPDSPPTVVTTVPEAPSVLPTRTTPSPSPSSSPSPAVSSRPSPSIDKRGPVVRSAMRIQEVVNGGIAQGSVTERAGRNVLNEVERAFNQYDEGDIEDAVGDIQDAREEVAKYLSKQDISPESAAALNGALNEYERAIVAVFLISRAREPSVPAPGREEYTAAYQGLCNSRALIDENLGRARDVFYGEAHTTLHQIADETTGKNRPLAAKLLEAMNLTERDLGGTVPANAAASMNELLRVSREALIFLGVPTRVCDQS